MKRNILLVFGFLMMMASLYLVFIVVSTEKVMGIVQRILYLMVPTGWLALLSFIVVFIGSILYLVKKDIKWDVLARSSAEIGFVCTTLALMVGMLWVRPTWGSVSHIWWSWGEPRLTATLVLWFIYLAYFMVRSFANEESRGARFAAVIGIVGFLDIPIVALATTIWQRGMHPPVMMGTLPKDMLMTLMVSITTFTILYFILLLLRVTMANSELDIKQLKERIG